MSKNKYNQEQAVSDSADPQVNNDPQGSVEEPVLPPNDGAQDATNTVNKENVVSPEPLSDEDKKKQEEYDVAREADEDALKQQHDDEAEEKEEHSRKPNDITEGENKTNAQVEISHSALEQLLRLPHVLHRNIGKNEYLLATRHHLKHLSESAREEIERIHGGHKTRVKDNGQLDHDNEDDKAEEYIAVPNRTVNTPQPFANPDVAKLSKLSHDDIFAKNVELDKALTQHV